MGSGHPPSALLHRYVVTDAYTQPRLGYERVDTYDA